MTDSELFQFGDIVRGLQSVFPKRLDEHERARLNRDYFKALRRFTLAQVQAGADAWVQRGKFFPKPAEWIDAIPTQRRVVDIPTMSVAEAETYRRAEALHYEDKPCACQLCKQAGIEKPLRFVPEFNADDTDRKVRDPLRDKSVTAGHWAHGYELARWYQARGDYYEAFAKLLGAKGMEKRFRA